MAHGLEAIDWSAPWHGPWRAAGQLAAQKVAQGRSVAYALNVAQQQVSSIDCAPTIQGRPRQFVEHVPLASAAAYEAHIGQTGQIPTRNGLHDFFNGLVWLALPRAKERLNVLHNAHRQDGTVRGAARDGLTLLDESGALFQGPDPLWHALCAKDWQRVFVDLRPLWAHTQVILFGHSLPEKLVQPRKSITAHVLRVGEPSFSLSDVDDWLALNLEAQGLATKPFAHLPVLGIPGWCAENAVPDFYADKAVFRSPKVALDAPL